jgi:alkanesulfonate monooxygenase SsuD/methylene tetrahydromethanopterin reductase-like flavin-dependent oxidoreductase (luciferase family)
MSEGTKTALPVGGRLDERIARRANAAAREAPSEDRVRVGLEASIEIAETDPAAARSALHELRSDHLRLSRLEAWLGGDPDRTTFGLGAAIQLADAELASPTPALGDLAPELLRWLEGDW